jgi:alpha-L-rhamnosidase
MKMFGSVEKFFYKDLAGIALEEPGYRTFAIRPAVVGDLTSASASLGTVRGRIEAGWEKGEDSLMLRAVIPANTTALVSVPTVGLESAVIEENGRQVWTGETLAEGSQGIAAARRDGDFVTFEVGSGTYEFKAVAGE